MMMRYQRVSPDCLPLSNGKKPSLRTSTCKEDGSGENGRTISGYSSHNTVPFDAKGFRFRSPSKSQDHHHHNLLNNGGGVSPLSENHHQGQRRESSPVPSPSRASGLSCGGSGSGGDVLLQWGQKKRARVPRVVTDESSSSGQAAKVQRKAGQTSARAGMEKPSITAMPPPPPPPPPPSTASASAAANGRGGSLRKESSSLLPNRKNLEERSGTASRSPSRNSGGGHRVVSRSMAGKRSPPAPDKGDRKTACSGPAKDEKPNGSAVQADHRSRADPAHPQSEQEGRNHNAGAAAEKGSAELTEWPRIYIALSRKEKEDDFLAMKGTKLPQRPKKRAKNIDKTLQYCFPGMWLSDLSRSRYEVREKKCVKKQKRRGLKGMESMDSDSE